MDNMTRNSNLFKMSIPIFVELLLQLLVGNIDQIMVSHHSQASVAAIVNGNQIMNIIIITMNMLCMATTVVLTQCLGAEDAYKSNQLCVLSMLVIGTVSMISTFVALFLNRPIFELMNIDSAILHETCLYLMIVGGFSLIQGLYLNFAAILRRSYPVKRSYGRVYFNECFKYYRQRDFDQRAFRISETWYRGRRHIDGHQQNDRAYLYLHCFP